jgi:cytochrome c-type biogenesis protein CcmH
MKRFRLLLAILAAIGSFLIVFAVQAQVGEDEPPTDNEVNAIAKKLYCPVCPNTPLDVCETTACQDWRAQIKDQLALGWEESEIIDYFVLQYGERVLAEPERRGFTSLVWLLPIIVLTLGIVLVRQVLRSWRSAGDSKISSPEELDIQPEIRARIEEQLEEM